MRLGVKGRSRQRRSRSTIANMPRLVTGTRFVSSQTALARFSPVMVVSIDICQFLRVSGKRGPIARACLGSPVPVSCDRGGCPGAGVTMCPAEAEPDGCCGGSCCGVEVQKPRAINVVAYVAGPPEREALAHPDCETTNH